ncbi:MAG TPA: SDR family oxidoreductase [Phycisphaerales bacterium]|nr:SDR family oxidoreductase [Phycisphaerales bacterium]
MEQQRILVTGGSGFIGSHLCRSLLNEGHEVLCLDNFFTGRKANVADLRGHLNFELIRHDLENPILLEVNQIYNLACPASPVHYQFNAVKTVKTNVLGTLNALGLAKRVKAKMLQASTSEVYGDPEVHPQTEDYWGNVNCLGPRACYDEGKRVAETLCMDYKRNNGVQVKIVRIFNTYGPNMALNDGRVVSNFIVQALKGEDITIYGEGNQTRAFCYVSDLIRGLKAMMNRTPGEFTGPVNLGNPQERTMLDLAETVIRLTNSTSKIQFLPLPEDDPKRRKPDISLAKKELGWQPEVSLEEGLSETIAYFDKVLSSKV